MNSFKFCFLAALAPLFLAVHASGAMITWQTPVNVNVNDDTQVVTNGAAISAQACYNGSGGPLEINGVTFAAPAPNVTIGYSGGSSFGTVTTDYSKLVAYSTFVSNGSSPTNPIVFSALTEGHTYQLQLWASYFPWQETAFFSTGVPNGAQFDSTAANQSPAMTVGYGGSIPQYILGTFVADNTGIQNLYYFGNAANDTPGGFGAMGAFQLRDLGPVPEPSTVALGALGVSAMLFRLRRRTR